MYNYKTEEKRCICGDSFSIVLATAHTSCFIMSMCDGCLQRMCRRHPLQDHGKRASEIKTKLNSTVDQTSRITQSYNDLIRAQITKLENEAKGTSEDDVNSYRQQMDTEREKAHKKKKRKMSDAEKDLALNTGLCSSILSVMMEHSDDEKEGEGSSSSDEEHPKSSKKSKKEKKEKKKKKSKDKKSKKEKKEKKERSSKKHKKEKSKKRKRSYSSSSSSSSSSDSEHN
jgi:hypothetical protein